jgi:hypothetical protein
MDDMCEKYRSADPDVTKLIEETRVHILATMNPDGYGNAAKAKVATHRRTAWGPCGRGVSKGVEGGHP